MHMIGLNLVWSDTNNQGGLESRRKWFDIIGVDIDWISHRGGMVIMIEMNWFDEYWRRKSKHWK